LTDIFEKHGLDVSLTLIQNLGLLPGTLGKQFDIAPSTPPDLINAAAKGLNVVGVTGGFIESSAQRSIEVIVRKDSGITGPKDLKDKLVAAAALGSLMHIARLYWVKKNGVDPNSIRAVEVPFPNMADQLKAGRVDAVESIQPFVSPLLAAGNVTIGDPILAVADPTHGTLWIAEGGWARAIRQSSRPGVHHSRRRPSSSKRIPPSRGPFSANTPSCPSISSTRFLSRSTMSNYRRRVSNLGSER
jgi:NitT/TauT family transport system substrate-binding protein